MKGRVKNRGNFRSILIILPAAIIMLFAFLAILPVVPASTYAEGDTPSEGIAITISDSVSAEVVLFDEGDYKIARDTVSVSSSAAYGYELFLSTDSKEHQSIYLNNDPTSSSVISPVAGTINKPAVLTSNTWGFAIAGQGNFDNEYSTTSPDPNSHFAIIPTTNNQAVYENNSATADDDIDFYYGIKIEPTLEPGEYETSATYTAIAKLPPLTAKAVLTENGNLNFIYDRNTYTVNDSYTYSIDGKTPITTTVIRSPYSIPMNSQCTEPTKMEWYGQIDLITSVNIDSSFANATPISTCMWFSYLPEPNNLQYLNTNATTDMSYMFYHSGKQNNDYSLLIPNSFYTDRVTNMSHMFAYSGYDAEAYALGGNDCWYNTCFNTINVTDMSYMFDHAGYSATTYTIIFLNRLMTSSVTNMSHMFSYAWYNADDWSLITMGGGGGWPVVVNYWDTSNVTDMSYMFDHAGHNSRQWSLTIRNGNTDKVTSMSHMFDHAGYGDGTINSGNVQIAINNWKTNSVTDMSYMFSYTGSYWFQVSTSTDSEAKYDDLSSWNVDNVTNMSHMFDHAGYDSPWFKLSGLDSWNTNNVTDMSYMFYYAAASEYCSEWILDDLSHWETGHVTNMSHMFDHAGAGTHKWRIGYLIDFWDTSNVTDMSYMFYYAGYNTFTGNWEAGNASGWNVENVIDHTNFIVKSPYLGNADFADNQPSWNDQ